MNTHVIERHQYDILLKHKNPMALRLNDANHQSIQVGDLIDVHGHNSIVDRQRFKVVDKMSHPSLESAIRQINHSGLDIRDKIKMTEGFMHAHGPESAHHEVVSLHLEPHPMPVGGSSSGSLKYL